MPRKRAKVEIGVTAGLLVVLAGCASDKTLAPPVEAASMPGLRYTPPPEQVDYMMALQCGALLWAEDRPDPRDRSVPPFMGPIATNVNIFLHWAEMRARINGHDPALALQDMAAMRERLLADAGDVTAVQMLTRLQETYAGELAACKSTADHADVITITVGG